MKSKSPALFPILLLALRTGCSTPIGVTRVSTQESHRPLTANALSAGKASEWSKQVLNRNGLFERPQTRPRRHRGGRAGQLGRRRRSGAQANTYDDKSSHNGIHV